MVEVTETCQAVYPRTRGRCASWLLVLDRQIDAIALPHGLMMVPFNTAGELATQEVYRQTVLRPSIVGLCSQLEK